MSDFRFGAEDYRLNIDWEHQAPDFSFGWDVIDWDRVEWVEIDNVKYVKEPTCTINECSWDDGQCVWGCKCSNCGRRFTYEKGSTWKHCPNCGARVEAVD